MSNSNRNDQERSANGSQNTAGNGSSQKGRGFAGMDPEQQRLIASQGGRAAHASGNAHEFTSEEARLAGRKGGEARTQSSRNRTSGEQPGTQRN